MEPFKLTGIDTISSFPFAFTTENGNGRIRGFTLEMTKVSEPLAPWHGPLIVVLQSNLRVSISDEKLELLANIDDVLAAYVDQKIASNPNTPLRYMEGPALNFPPGKKFPNEHFVVALREMQTLCVAWSRPLRTSSPNSTGLILALGGQGLFLTLFAVEVNRDAATSNVSYRVRLIARIPHEINGFVRGVCFGEMAGNNSTRMAVAASSGSITQFNLRFEFREKGVACVLESRQEIFSEDQFPATLIAYHPRDESRVLVVKNLIAMVISAQHGSKAMVCAHNHPITAARWIDLPSANPGSSQEEGDAMDIDEVQPLRYFLTSSMDGTLKLWSFNGNEILLKNQFDLKGSHNFKPLFGAAISPNNVFAMFLACNREKLSLDVASPTESHPRLGYVPLDLLNIEAIVDSILKGSGEEIVDWDLRRYLRSSRDSVPLFTSIFAHLLPKLESSSTTTRLRAAKLYIGLVHLWDTSFRSNFTEADFTEAFTQLQRVRAFLRVAFALDCLEEFVGLRQLGYDQSEKESQSLWNLYQDAKNNKALLTSADKTELFSILERKMDAFGSLIFASAREKALKFQCSLCADPVDLTSLSCNHGHPIAICSRTLTLLEDADFLRCVGCNSPSVPLSARQYPWQRLHPELCPVCGHRFRSSIL